MKPNPHPGIFFAFEGPEGGGKSTQARMLVELLNREGHTAIATKEPTEEGVFGRLVRFIYQCRSEYNRLPEELRRCMDDREFKLAKETENEARRRHLDRFAEIAEELNAGNHQNLSRLIQIGMTFDGDDHMTRLIIPQVGRGRHVVTDRWRLSTPSYGAGDGLDWRELLAMQYDVLGENFLAPNLVIFLDVPVELGLKRTEAKQQGRKEHFDDPDKMQRIRRAYREIFADPRLGETRVVSIDGTPDKETVHRAIWEHIDPLIAGYNAHLGKTLS